MASAAAVTTVLNSEKAMLISNSWMGEVEVNNRYAMMALGTKAAAAKAGHFCNHAAGRGKVETNRKSIGTMARPSRLSTSSHTGASGNQGAASWKPSATGAMPSLNDR